MRSVGQHTLQYASGIYSQTKDGSKPWPYYDWASTQYGPIPLISQNKTDSIGYYKSYDKAMELAAPLFNDGIGAITALLAATNDVEDLGTKGQAVKSSKQTFAVAQPFSGFQPGRVQFRPPLNPALLAPNLNDPNVLLQQLSARFMLGEISLDDYDQAADALVQRRKTGQGDHRRPSGRDGARGKQDQDLLRRIFQGTKMIVSPSCTSQPQPDVPVLRRLTPVHNSVGFAFDAVSAATSKCAVFIDVAVQIMSKNGTPKGPLQRIVLRSNEGKLVNQSVKDPNDVALTFFLDQSQAASPSRAALLSAFEASWEKADQAPTTSNWIWRARAMNANGLFSPWSSPTSGSFLVLAK